MRKYAFASIVAAVVVATTLVFTLSSEATGTLIGHWTFDDGLAADSSGNGNNGVVNGAVLAAGKVGVGSLDFDGVDDYVDLGNLDPGGSAITLAAWVNSDNLASCGSSDCRIASKATGTGEQDHYLMLSTINSGGGVKLRFRLKAGGTTTTLISSANLTNGQWIHVAGTYDGSNMRVYVNGVEVGIVAKTGAVNSGPAIPFWIGGNPPTANSRPWDGKIDDVRLYDGALSLSEIEALAGLTPPTPEPPTETPIPPTTTPVPPTPIPDEPQDSTSCSNLVPGANLRRCEYNRANWWGVDLSGADLGSAVLNDVNAGQVIDGNIPAFLDNVNLSHARIEGGQFSSVSLRNSDLTNLVISSPSVLGLNADFGGANLSRSQFIGRWERSNLSGVVANHAVFSGTDFEDSTAVGADFSDSGIFGVSFVRADLTDAKFDRSNVTGSSFDEATLLHTSFVDAYIGDATFLNAVLDGVNMSGTTAFPTSSMLASSIVNSTFDGADSDGVDWSVPFMSDVSFVGADLTSSKWTVPTLIRPDFTDAILLGLTFFSNNFAPVDPIWSNTICPDATNSDDNGGTCVGHGAAAP